MKSTIDHLPPPKQRELTRTVEVLLEEFDDALKGETSDFKKRGRILKIILFGSYARGGWVDEPHTKTGYRSDFDLLVVVNNRKLTDFAGYWQPAADRLMREIHTPVSFIVHSRREVNTALREVQYFFVDVRREGIVLYELDEEPLAVPYLLAHTEALRAAFAEGAEFFTDKGKFKEAAFLFHQSIEQAYAALLLILTNYSPASHNVKFLRSLAEDETGNFSGVEYGLLGPRSPSASLCSEGKRWRWNGRSRSRAGTSSVTFAGRRSASTRDGNVWPGEAGPYNEAPRTTPWHSRPHRRARTAIARDVSGLGQ